MRSSDARVTLALVVAGAVGSIGGCGGDDSKHATQCDLPGERGDCACEDGSEGIWVCGDNHSWGECNCSGVSEGGGRWQRRQGRQHGWQRGLGVSPLGLLQAALRVE